MVGKKVVSDAQREILVNYFAANPSCWNYLPSMNSILNRTKQWTELATILNGTSKGCQKSPRQWREYWNNLKYSVRSKATQIAREQESAAKGPPRRARIVMTDTERRMLSIMPMQQFQSSRAPDVDTRSPDSSQSSTTPLRVTTLSPVQVHSAPSVISLEHHKIVAELPANTAFLPPEKYLPAFKLDLPAKALSLQPEKTSPANKLDLPAKALSLQPEKPLPANKQDLPAKALSLQPEKPSPANKLDLPVMTPSQKPEKCLPATKLDLPVKAPSEKDSPAFNLELSLLPLQVAIVTANVSRIPFEDIDFIQKKLQQKIWDFMANPTTRCQPEFESCSKLEPYGLVFKCCNEDALEWLTTTIECSPFKELNLIVFLDTPGKLPTTVDMYVELTSDFELNKETSSIFNVLVRTNTSWLDTDKWTLLEDKCLPPTSDLAYPAKLSLVFSVPLSDVPKLRERGFKLHFLFGVVPINYYEEVKYEVSDSEIIPIKREWLE